MKFSREEAEMLAKRSARNRGERLATAAGNKAVRRQKFNATSVEIDGICFPSKIEGEYYRQAKLRVRSGELLYFLMQVPFVLPGPVRVRVAFLVEGDDDKRIFDGFEWGFTDKFFCGLAMTINDDNTIDDAEREKQLKKLFADNDVDLIFEGEYSK